MIKSFKNKISALISISMLAATGVALPSEARADYDIAVGEYLAMGTLPGGNAILWKCIATDDNGPLMLSDKVIDRQAFDSSNSTNQWVNSSVREYLHNDFMEKFNMGTKEQKAVKSVAVAGCVDTFFLLSSADAANIFADNAARKTTYYDGSYQNWWLRTSASAGRTFLVDGQGRTYNGTSVVNNVVTAVNGIRPAFYPDMSRIILSGSGTAAAPYTLVECYTVTAEAGEGGTVSGTGTYAAGSDVTITAAANSGRTFKGWYDETGALVSTDRSLAIKNLREDKSYIASFSKGVGDYLAMGTDPAGNDILWKWISNYGAYALLLSENILDRQVFDEQNSTDAWAESSVRKYFTDGTFAEKFHISSEELKSVSSMAFEQGVSDKFFLLSYSDASNTKLFANDAARVATYYDGSYQDWWLRTRRSSKRIWKVRGGGGLTDNGLTASGGIRPACCINMSNAALTGSGTHADPYRLIEKFNVTAEPASGGAAVGTYDSGQLTLTATANEGRIFEGWYEDETKISDEAVCQVSGADISKAYTAKFTKIESYWNECEEAISKWVETIAGNSIINSSGNAMVQSRIAEITRNANTRRQRLIKEMDSAELFTDIATKTTAEMSTTASYIYQMALAYATYGSELYHNEELLGDVIFALNWFCENRYGLEAKKNASSWLNGGFSNWYDWELGTPGSLIPTLMLIRHDISDEVMLYYLSGYDVYNSDVSPERTASNRISHFKNRVGSYLLKGYADSAKHVMKLAESEFAYVDHGEGFFEDGSYVFHGHHAMNAYYGLGHLGVAADLFSSLAGTAFELPEDRGEILSGWIINCFDSLVYKNKMPRMVFGRLENPNQISQSKDIMTAALKCFYRISEQNKLKIGSIIKEYASYNNIDFFAGSAALNNIEMLYEIAASDEYNDYDHDSSNMFGAMDKAFLKRKDWAAGISMMSSRIYNYENILDRNKTGWYLSDGRTEFMLKDEGLTSSQAYWTNIDYYRLPGTTVDTQEREALSESNAYLSSKDFVGGVEMDSRYITAAMELESYHNDDSQNGSIHKCDLTAKKSYFMFDNEVFCLGADVHASDNNNAEVLTVIENRIPQSASLASDGGKVTVTKADTQMNNVKWMNVDGKLGYYFPNDGNTDTDPVKVRLSNNGYFESWFSHGVNPNNKTYAYTLLPNMTAEETAAYADDPGVEVLSNTGSVQAVKNEKLGITSIVFWEPGTFEGVTVSNPMIVMEQRQGRQTKIAVSDPTQKLKSASITFDDGMQLVSGDDHITKASASSIDIDFTNSLGATYQAELIDQMEISIIGQEDEIVKENDQNGMLTKVTAPEPGEGKAFMGWYNGDKVRVETDRTYNVTSADTKLAAVYADETDTPKMQTAGKGEAVTDDNTVGHTGGQAYKDTVATVVESVVDIPSGYPVQYVRWQITTDKKAGAATAVYETDGAIEGTCEFAIIIPDVEMDDDTLKISIVEFK